MLTAILVGLAASSALVIGAVLGAFWEPPKELVTVALAFSISRRAVRGSPEEGFWLGRSSL